MQGINVMKILIGTPIHEMKDYSMARWVENVSKLEYPADLLMVDNSPGLDYLEKVKGYCKKYGVADYKIKHIEIGQNLDADTRRSLGVEASQETIRQEVLSKGYDAWFSWECDQIIPTHALDKLIELMQRGNYMMVIHNCWSRHAATDFSTDMGVTLITRECLEKAWFLPKRNGQISLDLSDMYDVNLVMFKKRVLQSGGNYVEAYGIIKPIYHLNQ